MPRTFNPPALMVSDMDGTLLDEHGQIPCDFWPVLDELQARDIAFAVASGRQYLTLVDLFRADSTDVTFIAENGAQVVRNGVELHLSLVPPALCTFLVNQIRQLASTADLGLVLCGRDSGYVERTDDVFLAQAGSFYSRLTVVPDLLSVNEPALKFALYDGSSDDSRAARIARLCDPLLVSRSAPRWMDIMVAGQHKGVAVRRLQSELKLDRTRTIVFGDHLNDLEMLSESEHSFAMTDAHPDVLRRARHVAPSNREQGVIRVITQLLDHTLKLSDPVVQI